MDYCDRCGAAGKTRFIMWNDSDLVFCGHHTREYNDKMLDIAKTYQDLTDESPALLTV